MVAEEKGIPRAALDGVLTIDVESRVQWEEILGCNNMTTASYFSDRTGEITVAVSSVRKNYYTIRATDYVPEYSESTSVGKRQLLLPDEVLRFHKMDYIEHIDAKKLKIEKVEEHIPEWYQKWEQEKAESQICEEGQRENCGDTELHIEDTQEADILALDTELPKKAKQSASKNHGKTIMKVEDLFSKDEGRG